MRTYIQKRFGVLACLFTFLFMAQTSQAVIFEPPGEIIDAPTITGFWSKDTSTKGTLVTVFGSNFIRGDTTVSVSGVTAQASYVLFSSILVFQLPEAAMSGQITVATSLGSGISSASIGAVNTGLSIVGFWPGQAYAGSVLFVFGSGFVRDDTTIAVNGTASRIAYVVDESLVIAMVPLDATSGPITVSTSAASVTSTESLTVTAFSFP